MPTIIVTAKGSPARKWLSMLGPVLVAFCVGGLVGASKGSALADLRNQREFVPREDYERVYGQYERLVERHYYDQRRQMARIRGKSVIEAEPSENDSRQPAFNFWNSEEPQSR